MPEGVARKGIHGYEGHVDQQEDRPEADVEAVREEEPQDGVVQQDEDENDRRVEGEAMQVLEDKREAALAGVVLAGAGLGHGAGGRVEEEGPVVGQPVVVAGQPEAERKDQNIDGRGDGPAEDAPTGDQQWRVKGGKVWSGFKVLVFEGPPRRVDNEGAENYEGYQRPHPPHVAAAVEGERGAPGFFALRGRYSHEALLSVAGLTDQGSGVR